MSEFYDDFEDEFGDDFEDALDEASSETSKGARKKQKFNVDILLTVVGLCLAGSSAFLPWYVFFNQEKFGIQRMAYSDDRILPETWAGRPVVSVSPQAIPGRDNFGIQLNELPPDEITTASIPEGPTSQDQAEGDDPLEDGILAPSGMPPRYRLLHVVNERALIEDASGTYMVKVGSVLPDNSTLEMLEMRGNDWALITSNGDVLLN